MLQSILTATIEFTVISAFVLFFIAFCHTITMSKKSFKFPVSTEISNPEVYNVSPKVKEEILNTVKMPEYNPSQRKTANQSMTKEPTLTLPMDKIASQILDRKPTMEELRNTARDLRIKGWNLPNIKYETLERKIFGEKN